MLLGAPFEAKWTINEKEWIDKGLRCVDIFQPGADYGFAYQYYLWVCTNPVSRGFEKCDPDESLQVLADFRQKIQQYGLGRKVFVFQSAHDESFSVGCLLGCKAQGTTVALASQNPSCSVLFFRNVRRSDVESLIQQYLMVENT